MAGASAGKPSGKTTAGAAVVKLTGVPASVGLTFVDWGLDIYEATYDLELGFEYFILGKGTMKRSPKFRGRRPGERWYLTGRTAVLGGLASVGGLIGGLNPFLEVSALERLALIGIGVGGVVLLIASVNAITDRW